MTTRYFTPEWLTHGFFAFFGSWTLLCNAVALSNGDFQTLCLLSPLPVLATVGLLRLLPPDPAPAGALEAPPPGGQGRRWRLPSWPVGLGLAVANVALFAGLNEPLLFWGVGSALLIANRLQVPAAGGSEAEGPEAGGPARGAATPEPTPASFGRGMLALAAAAALFTLFRYNFTADDAFYHNVVITLLDHPDWPLLLRDGMYGEDNLPILLPLYRFHAFEPFVAWLSWLTGLDPLDAHHVLVPPAMAAMAVVAQAVALRRYIGAGALAGLAVTVLLLMLWPQRLVGLHPLFIGKGILATICVPMLAYAAGRFAARPGLDTGLLLALGQVAAAGFSSSGLILAPLTVALVLLGHWRGDRAGLRPLVLGMLTALHALLVLVLASQEVAARGGFGETGLITNLFHITGKGVTAYLGLTALFAAAMVPGPAWRARAGYLLVAFVVLFCPATPDLATRMLSNNMSWRIFWSLPLPLVAGMAAGALWLALGRRRAVLGLLVLAAVGTAATDLTTQPRMFEFRFAGHKVPAEREIAEAAIAVTPADGVILAAEPVATWVPTVRRAPRVVAVRRHYISQIWSLFGDAEAQERIDLLDYVSGRRLNELARPAILDAIRRRGIGTVVIRQNFADRRTFAGALEDMGFRAQKVGNFEIWSKATSAPNSGGTT